MKYRGLVGEGRDAEALALKRMHVPMLYRYMTLADYTIEAIEKLAVYMSSAASKSDPLEIPFFIDDDLLSLRFYMQGDFIQQFYENYGKEILAEEVSAIIQSLDPQKKFEEICLQKGINRDFVKGAEIRKNIFAWFHGRQRERLRLCSFSETNIDMAMWSNYADQHKGICVAYNFASAMDVVEHLEPVLYSNNKIELTEYLGGPNSYAAVLFAGTTKSTDYLHEREWRIIFPHDNDGYYKVPAPTAIYLGLRFSQNKIFNRDRLAALARQLRIPLYRMMEQSGTIGVCDESQ